jgi:hypothetical protein
MNSNIRQIITLFMKCRMLDIRPSAHLLLVSVASQQMLWLEKAQTAQGIGWSCPRRRKPAELAAVSVAKVDIYKRHRIIDLRTAKGRYRLVARRLFRISTSRFGIGQLAGSNRTPLGLHRVGVKIGAGQPLGTVFECRRPVGLTWQGQPRAAIAHRILRLEGLEPGFNQGGDVDSFRRYIYIHGLGDEPSLGRPASRGCIHMAAADLMPLFDRVPVGTLVWITKD